MQKCFVTYSVYGADFSSDCLVFNYASTDNETLQLVFGGSKFMMFCKQYIRFFPFCGSF